MPDRGWPPAPYRCPPPPPRNVAMPNVAMPDDLTELEQLNQVLSQIKQYAMEHNISAERVHVMFNVGIAAARLLLPQSK